MSPRLIRLLPMHPSIGPTMFAGVAANSPLAWAQTASPGVSDRCSLDALRQEQQA
ncbi:hypothetical protein M3O57_17445 [Xanthomonas nasturtii]|uniref:hypothetical protein n=1 Tax=Xanthomonas nasturtii TaxID=1843581 RepID=UPI00137B7474|nr:hypothetical protein [Xanthomonas nasturtii]MCL1502786.1 hypothetical protein [Xanthomonas nasturtii]MCL1522663.1 hypothetical protein [Xanthomonas nasturtii]MCL1532141.1 hypothetical protein [Xanthomonas nasturtii]MCL1560125.1 hypothetical protein [Xanthomonas nasturtii]MCL1566817.1 hypothetical protein [Xanthomonas nasturtii]